MTPITFINQDLYLLETVWETEESGKGEILRTMTKLEIEIEIGLAGYLEMKREGYDEDS